MAPSQVFGPERVNTQYKMTELPKNRPAAGLSFNNIGEMNNDVIKTLIENFKEFMNPDIYAFQGDYVGVSTDAKLDPTLELLQTKFEELTSDHIFVKATFSENRGGGGIRRRRVRRSMKHHKRTKKNHRKVSPPKFSHKRLRNRRKTK